MGATAGRAPAADGISLPERPPIGGCVGAGGRVRRDRPRDRRSGHPGRTDGTVGAAILVEDACGASSPCPRRRRALPRRPARRLGPCGCRCRPRPTCRRPTARAGRGDGLLRRDRGAGDRGQHARADRAMSARAAHRQSAISHDDGSSWPQRRSACHEMGSSEEARGQGDRRRARGVPRVRDDASPGHHGTATLPALRRRSTRARQAAALRGRRRDDRVTRHTASTAVIAVQNAVDYKGTR
jgi:hypothetical protein